MKYIKYIFLVVLLYSCSAQWHLDRAKKKDPSLFKAVDTMYIKDTVVYTQSYVHEDSFYYTLHDTIKYEDTFVKIRLVVKNRTVYMKAEVKPDTLKIRTHTRVQYDKIIVKRDWYWYIGILFVLLCLSIYYNLRK
jgi:hypothetical protein